MEIKRDCILYSSQLKGREACKGLQELFCRKENCKFYKSNREYEADGRRKEL